MGIDRVERVEACRTCRLGGESIVSRFRSRRLAGGGDFNAKRRESEVGL